MAKDRVLCAVDIGSSKVATLIASVSEDDRLNLIGVSAVSSRGVKKGQVVDIDDAVASITESIEAAERMAGYSISSVFVTVGGPQIESTNSHAVVAIAKPEGEIEENDVLRVNDGARAVTLPASKEILHVIPRMFTVDGQEGIRDPVGMTGVRLETDTHIVTASTGAMKNLVRCMSLVGGINIDELVFSGIAASYATLTDTEKELGVILVDIGGETTDIVIFVDGAIAHSAVIPIGARHITSDLAVGLRVSLESAEKIKVYLGKLIKAPTLPEATEKGVKVKDELIDIKSLGITEEIKMSKKTAVDSIIRPRTREIFELIGKEIKKSGFATQTPSGLVICGGGASTVGILEQAKYTLGYPARVGRPEGLNGLTEEIDSPSFAAAAGLILYGSKSAVSNNFGLPALTTGLPIQKLVQKGIDLVKSFLP
ncbi:cell division protein FtsA [Candidatus Daviesbacteria bacterium RIFCSPHIGHO2_02_FULL_41_14]|uniref:Cell division protein FtsA n=1 Tax=Candidatus Daviesbacteria bacterium RIFCSPLOWO2_01_FULL_40_24 TaxID=1797787 RepID=A0A1F5MJ40_9BACT|nr:MAG: cell division protein FtsA [Candidatus Daviesbacteria bacterium RIFCSPHIGHO2_01_FULL_41_45]OGE34485.1 MAG: cell division protein FtsA [Candidatus Daviesbacteria bacterium RIFCSPHIGHO2_02_FULL_41_14]OGE65397.1 MAG: cell division protein FtsA [Candidatus Daviesbacteria bacterium RIFCSPLOWO2_01_FULL_40_24]